MEKRLYKINQGKMVDGVCGGIAQYFGLDPTLVRLAWIVFTAMAAAASSPTSSAPPSSPGSRRNLTCNRAGKAFYELFI